MHGHEPGQGTAMEGMDWELDELVLLQSKYGVRSTE